MSYVLQGLGGRGGGGRGGRGGGGFRGGGQRMGGGRGWHRGGRGRGWGRRGRRGWGWWGSPGYVAYDIYDPCVECYGLPPAEYGRCMTAKGCVTPLLGLGQAATPASLAVQETVNRTAGLVAGTIAGGVIGLGVGIVGLGWLAYYMLHRSRRPSRNRRRSR